MAYVTSLNTTLFQSDESGKNKKEEQELDKKKFAVKIQLPEKVCLVTENCQRSAVERSCNKSLPLSIILKPSRSPDRSGTAKGIE